MTSLEPRELGVTAPKVGAPSALHLECICAMTSLHHFLLAAADVYLVLSAIRYSKISRSQWNVVFQLSFRIFLLVKYYAKKRIEEFYFVYFVSRNSLNIITIITFMRRYAMGKIFITRVYDDIQGLKHFLRSCEMRFWFVISSAFYI